MSHWETDKEDLTKVKCEKCKHDMAYHKFAGRVCTYKVKPTAEFPFCDCELGLEK